MAFSALGGEQGIFYGLSVDVNGFGKIFCAVVESVADRLAVLACAWQIRGQRGLAPNIFRSPCRD